MKSVRMFALTVRHGLPWALLAFALVLLVPALAAARPLPEGNRSELLSPLSDATLSESGLTFAWTPAAGTSEHFLLVSETAFDPAGWTDLPTGAGVRVVRAARPQLDWSALGKRLVSDTRVWWAAADRDPASRRLVISEVRTAYVLHAFSNQAEQSPLVAVSPIGRATPAAPGPRHIHLAAGFEIDPALGEPALLAKQRLSESAVGGRRTFLVFYADADPEVTRQSIVDAGGRVVSYLPDHTFLVRMNATGQMALNSPAAWVGAYQPAYKLSGRLSTEATTKQAVTVLLFPDADMNAAIDAARAAGASVTASSDNGINKVLRLESNRAGVDAMAANGDVAWIEPYVMPQTENANAQGIVQTGVVGNRRVWDLGLKGEGQVVMTTDSGINTTHIAIKDPLVPITTFGAYPTHRKLIEYDRSTNDPSVVFGDHGSFHGSHTAGTVAGNNDALGTNTNDGMAKNAKLWFTDMSGPSLGTGLVTPADLNDMYQIGYNGNAGGAPRICSNSWGSDVAGAYTVEALQVDQFLWNHPDFMLFYSNGNAGPGTQTVGTPAVAKDCVSVGAGGNGASLNSLASFSSRGPCVDNRVKPTICAPGSGVTSSTTGDSTYVSLSGTSMSCPATTGCAALMRQYLTEGWYPTGTKVPGNGFTPSGALIKAMVVNSGNKLNSENSPNFDTGWGRVDADSVLYFAGDAQRLLLIDQANGLGNGQAIEYAINVTDNSIPLRVALVWNDYPGNPLATIQLVNNLDLVVTKGGTTYLGNVFTSGASATGGTADDRNVEECARIAAPATGVWTVRVNGTNIPAGPQPFALVITGGLGTTAGTLALDRASYGSGSTVQLRVTDTNASGPINVSVTSPTETGGETAVLTGSNGVFTGSLPLSPLSGTVGDGTLRVSNGDLITAIYSDASPVATIVAKAQIGLEPPTITNVFAQGSGGGAVTVTWSTSASADSRVFYGPTSDLGSSTTLDPLATVSHVVSISNLTVGQLYYYDVESRDLNGNVSRDDNGGLHYRFTPGAPADLLLVYDGSSFEKATRYTTALAATGWSYDVWAGDLSDTPRLGDSTTGLRSYRAVWWQNGIEHYPPFSDAARDSLAAYLNGGGRLAVTGHDVAWANGDPTSQFWSAARSAWLSSTLHTTFVTDPTTTWSGVTGTAADPISGAYTGGLSYTPPRSGAAGDEISSVAGAGTATYDWISGTPAPNNCGFRWESSAPLGSGGVGVWGGQTSRLATNYFEWSTVDNGVEASALRNDVLQKTLVWLIGRDKPAVAVTAPNGGEVLTLNSVNVSWTETTPGGVSARTIEYSVDGGASWTTITTSAGASPYAWSLTSVPNSSQALVRVRVTDAGTPSLSTTDASNAVFAINRVGGDATGPAVVAGSIHASPNPIDNAAPATATATVSDALSGGAAVAAAEWSYGEIPAPPGLGHAMTGAFGTPTVTVTAALATGTFTPGLHRLWVRGQDALGNWGGAGALQIQVNGAQPLSVGGVPVEYALGQGVPNPAESRSLISFSLPARGDVDLAIYDVTGRRVRSLVSGPQAAGVHESAWDLRDEAGGLVRAGVYYYRLDVAGRTFTRRLIALN